MREQGGCRRDRAVGLSTEALPPRHRSIKRLSRAVATSADALCFDRNGRLWIQTDGAYTNSGDYANMGNNQMLCADPATGEVRRFLAGASGCEVTGVVLTPDSRTIFVNIQHPGEIGDHPNAPRNPPTGQQQIGTVWTENQIARDPTRFSCFPDGGTSGRPRFATVVIRKIDGGVIGS